MELSEHRYQKALTFSYDDGVTQDRRLVELFNQYGLKATFNLNTGIQSETSRFEIEGVPICRMEQKGLEKLYAGHEIAVHGLTHAALTGLKKEELEHELGADIKNIKKLYGVSPKGMAYAYGAWNEDVVACLREMGISYGRTVGSTHAFHLPEELLLLEATCHHDDDRLFLLAEEFLKIEPKPGEQLLFYVWGHSYEFDVNRNWDRIERFCEMMSGREDIFYGSNAACLELFGCI